MSSHPDLPADADAAAAAPPGAVYGLLAEYDGVMPLLAAAQKVRDAGYVCWDTYTPIPVHGLDEAMGIRRTRLPWVVFGAGMTGGLLALLMQWWMNAFNYPYVVSGKPMLALPPYIPIIFEVTVLFSAITAFVGMLMFNKLPALYHGVFGSRAFATRVTTDRFFLGVEARDARFDAARTQALLESTGAIGIETIVETGRPVLPAVVRRYALPAAVVLAAAALVPPLLIARAGDAVGQHAGAADPGHGGAAEVPAAAGEPVVPGRPGDAAAGGWGSGGRSRGPGHVSVQGDFGRRLGGGVPDAGNTGAGGAWGRRGSGSTARHVTAGTAQARVRWRRRGRRGRARRG